MRVLVACGGGYGHLHPHLPLAAALADAGHAVAFALPESFRQRVERAGFAAIPVPPDREEMMREVERRFPNWAATIPDQRFSLVHVGAEIIAPMMLSPLLDALEEWRADLLVHGPAVYAGPLAARLAGIPSVNQSWGALLPLSELRLAAEALADLWKSHALPPPPFAGLFDYLYLDVAPPSLQDPEIAEVGVAHPLRHTPLDAVGDEDLPRWVASLSDRPTVCVTLGTFYNRLTNVFAAVLEGVRQEPVNVIALVGYDLGVDALGPQPDHVRVEHYVPLSLLLPHCDLLVTHGGSGSVLTALGEGVPLLVVPMGADQSANARRAEACGAGRWVAPSEARPARVRDEVAALLAEPGFRQAARGVRREMLAMPGPRQQVALLAELAREGRPLFSR